MLETTIKPAIKATTNKRQTSHTNRKWLLVGTAFLHPEETIPSSGRLLMFNAKTLELEQEMRVDGSIQAIVISDHNRFLILGVNNQI